MSARDQAAAYTCTSCGFATALCVCSDGPRDPETGHTTSAAQGQREPQYVYAESREEAQRLLDNSYLKKYRAVPASPFHERFWWLPVATVAAGCLALTGVLVWLSYFGPWSHV